MAAIDFPTAAESREDYDINNPWTDPINGGEWWFSPTKVRWLPVPAGGGGASVSDTAYDATSWNGVTDEAPSKNAVRDKFESLPTVVDAVTNGDANAVSSNAVFDALALKAPLDSPVFTGPVDMTGIGEDYGATISSDSGFGAFIHSNSGTGAEIYSYSGSGAYIYSNSGTGAEIYSYSGSGAEIYSDSGTYHAAFGNTGIDRSFVARLKGAFGWIRGAFTGRIYPPDILTGDWTWELPDAEGTLALTSDINTLAKLDTIVADATLARTDAGQTFAGAQVFSGQISSSGSTDATNTNNVVNVATNDARYGREYIQIISTAVNAYSTAFVNGPDLVLPAGTYDFELFGFLEIVGETSGGDLNFRCSPATDVTTAVETRMFNISALGTSGTAGTSLRKGTVLNLADNLGTTYAIAPNNYGMVQTRGTTVLASETTVSFRVKQRVTDAVNPATLAVGSFIKFTKR